LIFLALGVCTGMIWARPLWGQWWVGDMKLTSTAQLLYLTLGYVLLRRGVRDSRDLHWSNWILGILILPDVIIAYFANQWFRTQHPQPVIGGGQGSGLDVRMAYTLVVTTATLFILFLYIVRTRLGIYRLSRERLALQDSAALNTFLRLGL
jgi:heme exporter protein C